MAAEDIVVVGAGVVGLSTAISLAEAGLSTRVVAAEPPSRVTSVAAGAIWGPVRCGPDDRCREWARTGLEVLVRLVVHRARRQYAGLPAVPARPVREPGRQRRVRDGAVAGVGRRADRRE